MKRPTTVVEMLRERIDSGPWPLPKKGPILKTAPEPTPDPAKESREAMERVLALLPPAAWRPVDPSALRRVLVDLHDLAAWEAVAHTGSTLGGWASESDGTRDRKTTDAEVERIAALCQIPVPRGVEGEGDVSSAFALALLVARDPGEMRGVEAKTREKLVAALSEYDLARPEPLRLQILRTAIEGDETVQGDAETRLALEPSGLTRRVLSRDWTRHLALDQRMTRLGRAAETLPVWAVLRAMGETASLGAKGAAGGKDLPPDPPETIAQRVADRLAPLAVRRMWERHEHAAKDAPRGAKGGRPRVRAGVPTDRLGRVAFGSLLLAWAVGVWVAEGERERAERREESA